jgi:hypothetical protein
VPVLLGILDLLSLLMSERRGTSQMHNTPDRPKIIVTTHGHGVASHAGSRLLADLADRCGITEAYGDLLAGFTEVTLGSRPGPGS